MTVNRSGNRFWDFKPRVYDIKEAMYFNIALI